MHSRYRLALPLVVAIVVVTIGCSRYGGSVVAEVNGHTLRSEEVDARATNMAALHLHKTGKIDKLEKLKNTFRKGYAKVWVEDRVIEDAMKAAGIKIPKEVLDRCYESAFRNFRAEGDKGYKDFLSLPGVTPELWEDQVLSEARRLVMRRRWLAEEPLNLPTNYADKVIADMAKWNENMAKTNTIQYAKATNVWEKLKAGADFVKTARLNTENEAEIEDNCEWGTIDDKFLSDEPVLMGMLKTMKVGEYTPPIDADGCILIVRLDEVDKEENAYTVSRIVFRKGRVLTPAPKEEIVAEAKKNYVKKLFQRRLGELVKASGAKFADGAGK